MKKLLCLLLLFMLTLPLSAFKCQEISDKNGNYIRIESDELILHIRRMGGCIARYYYKQGRQGSRNISETVALGTIPCSITSRWARPLPLSLPTRKTRSRIAEERSRLWQRR